MDGELPPEWMWSLDHELEWWFERVEAERAEKYGTSRRSDDDDDESEMMTNDLARGRK